jgi:predicted Zn-dependent protease
VIDRRSLVRALQDRRVADWVLTERRQELAAVDAHAQLQRRETRTQWTLVVHDDHPNGRGTARVTIEALGGGPHEVVDQALALAAATLGPAWQSSPLAAPAKVLLDDPALAHADLVDVATTVLRDVRAPDDGTAVGNLALMREQVDVQTHGGLRAAWAATYVRGGALVAVGPRSLPCAREARRVSDLGLGDAITSAASDLRVLAGAGVAIAGPCAVVLGADALLHGGGFGVWSVFATQADAVVEREGLTRYRVGAAVVPGAGAIAEPLSIASDGALDFRTGSARMGDGGDAVRRFAIVDGGIAAGLALTPREAAFRNEDPNGGVRNLVVAPGSWSGEIGEPAEDAARVVEVRRLRSLSIDAYTGDASLEIALGIDHVRGEARPFAGGTLRLDLVSALALARRSRPTIQRGPYDGPAAVWIDSSELLA